MSGRLGAESTTAPFGDSFQPALGLGRLLLNLLERRVNLVAEPAERSGQDLEVPEQTDAHDGE